MRIVRPTLSIVAVALVALVSFIATAFAAGATVPEDGSIIDLARPVWDAIMAGHYVAGAALALCLTLALAKRYAPGKAGAFLNSDAGGALSLLGMAFFGAIATGTIAGEGWGGLSWGLALASAKVAAVAAGGFAIVKKLIVEPIRNSDWYLNTPAWLKSLLQVVFWIFDKQTATDEVIAEAEKAGEDAVKANPGTGAAKVIGRDPEKF